MNAAEFEAVLDRAADILAENLRSSELYHGPEEFQQGALDMLRVAARDCDVSVDPSFHPHAFPDIVVNGFGVEVKFTKRDTWHAVGNSVFEGMRDETVRTVYVLFGKIGGDEASVRWGRYEDSIVHVRVSNSPRFVLDMEPRSDPPLFEQFGIGYDAFAELSDIEKMGYIRDYSRSRLRRGERLWWLQPSHSIPLHVRSYMVLTREQKRQYRAEAAILFPQVCGPSRQRPSKYIDPALYLLMHHGVFCSQARDLFSAGSVAGKERGGNYVLRALQDIQPLMCDAALRLDDELFEEYWGESCPPLLRIPRWLEMADSSARDWTPSDHLFTDL